MLILPLTDKRNIFFVNARFCTTSRVQGCSEPIMDFLTKTSHRNREPDKSKNVEHKNIKVLTNVEARTTLPVKWFTAS